ncbi:hypothetical protein PEC302107_36000 [Pectobacterium araliae]|nr:hypothetical protein PEC302107_36000 [Pectobacterium carotovorum subsp. carotovorum]
MEPFDLKELWLSLSNSTREKIATEAGTTNDYVRMHLVYRKKMPRKDMLKRLVKSMNSNGVSVTESSLLLWFFDAA